MSSELEHLSPDRETTAAWWSEAVDWTASTLGVPAVPIRLRLCANVRRVSWTDQCPLRAAPTVYLSPDRMIRHVAAHEIAHALIPTRFLFLSEGLASWIGCLVTGDCRHLLFDHPSIPVLLRDKAALLPELGRLVLQEVNQNGPLSPNNYYSERGRLAHAVAASFAEYCINRFDHYPLTVARQRDCDPPTLFARYLLVQIEPVLEAWRKEIGIESPP